MTIETAYAPDRYAGDDASTVFAVTFPFFSEDEIEVVIVVDATGVETVQTKTTHYTVSGGGVALPATGTVTMIAAPATGETLILRRVTDREQAVDLTRSGPISPDSLEGALDRAIMLEQEDDEAAGRALRVPKGDDPTLDMEIPSEVDRASTYLGFDSDGEPIPLAAPTSTALTTPWSKTLLDDVSAESGRATLMAGAVDARGDLLVGDSDPKAAKLALGTSGQVLGSDGSDALWVESPLPRGYQAGCVLSAGDTPDEELNVSAGAWRDSADGCNLVVPSQLVIDNTVTGAALGVFDAGGVQADTEYHVFLIRKDSDGSISAGLDTTLTCDSIPAGYTEYRRIGTRFTDGTSDFIHMIQFGDHAYYDPTASGLDLTDTGDFTSGTTAAIDVPTGFRVIALLRAEIDSGSGPEEGVYIFCPDLVDEAPAVNSAPLSSITIGKADEVLTNEIEVLTNASGQIRYRSNHADISLRILTRGWIDTRGRDD